MLAGSIMSDTGLRRTTRLTPSNRGILAVPAPPPGGDARALLPALGISVALNALPHARHLQPQRDGEGALVKLAFSPSSALAPRIRRRPAPGLALLLTVAV
jgi:hypothetical protein